MKRLLFVCAGNTCRSPMAAAIARSRLGDGITVSSAGIHCGAGARAATNAIAVMRERGIDLTDHSSRPISDFEISESDIIVAMTPAIARHLNVGAANVIVWSIDDPIGGSLDAYRRAATAITSALESLIERVL